jgi:DNA replication licensing factor MCM2
LDAGEDDVEDTEGAGRAGAGGIRRRRPRALDDDDGDDEEEEGEDLLEEGYREDYRTMPLLDTYEGRGIDRREYERISEDARHAAEAEIRSRERAEMRRQGTRLPLALQDTDDEGSELEPSRQRRRMAERAAGEMDFDEDDIQFALDDFDVPLKEWIAQERPRREIKKRFRNFIRMYLDEGHNNVYDERIRAMCAANEQSLEVSYLHLSRDAPLLAIWLADAPKNMLQIFNEVTGEVVLQQFADYKEIHDQIFVRITDLPIRDNLRELRQVHLNALIKVGGVVTRRTSVFPQLKYVRFTCNGCNYVTDPYHVEGGEMPTPNMCPQCEGSAFTLDLQRTLYRNYQRLTLQESPGTVAAGRVPRHKDVILLDDLIDKARPGEEIEVTGIYMNTYDVRMNAMQGFPVFSTVIEANFIQKGDTMLARHLLTEEDKRRIRELSRDPRIGERIVDSIAPSIYGLKKVKRAIALSMFGGREKNINNKHHVRGDINCLIMGDPGCAKSQFLKYVEKTAPRTVYSTGKGASAVGLTAAVQKDPVTREWTLEGGALVLADRGICLIDEFDKMNDSDRTSIHEAMEQQSISISKAGIVTTLKARCAIIAAANPIGGRYDPQRTFAENVELTDPILSRFDNLCVLIDEVNPVQDERLAKFVVGSHIRSHPAYGVDGAEAGGEEGGMPAAEGVATPQKATTAGGDVADPNTGALAEAPSPGRSPEKGIIGDAGQETIPQDLLRKYLMYARAEIKPQLQNIDQEKVKKLYADLRREAHNAGGVPITVRHIESIMRMSEANAKMHLREYVRDDDLDMAIRVMIESFIDAQKYSVQRTLRRKFRKYLVFKQHNNSLIMYVLEQLVREQQAYQQMRNDFRNNGKNTRSLDDDEVEIRLEDLEGRAREFEIHDLSEFFRSNEFTSHNYTLDRKRGLIRHSI